MCSPLYNLKNHNFLHCSDVCSSMICSHVATLKETSEQEQTLRNPLRKGESWKTIPFHSKGILSSFLHTKLNISPEKGDHVERKFHLNQPSIFRVYVTFGVVISGNLALFTGVTSRFLGDSRPREGTFNSGVPPQKKSNRKPKEVPPWKLSRVSAEHSCKPRNFHVDATGKNI